METSPESHGETLFDLTLYAADTPANPSPSPDTAAANTTPDTYGRGFEKPLADYDPDTQSWKMFGDTFLSGDSPLLETLPPSGMTRNGVLYPRPPWEPLIGVTVSLSWPTAIASLGQNSKWYLRPDGYRHNPWELPPGMEPLAGLPINPRWWEWMMGFPSDWTDLDGSETP